MSQKTSNSFDNLFFDDWSSLLSWNAIITFDTRFDSGKISDGFDEHDSLDSHNGHDGHDTFNSHNAAMY